MITNGNLTRPWRRFIRFRLLSFLSFITVFCVLCQHVARTIAPYRKQARAFQAQEEIHQADILKLQALSSSAMYPGNHFQMGEPEWLQMFLPERLFVQQDRLMVIAASSLDLRFVKDLPWLREIRLRRCDLTKDSLANLSQVPRLESLRLTEMPLTDSMIDAINKIESHLRLEIRFGKINSDQDLKGIDRLKIPATIKLGSNQTDDCVSSLINLPPGTLIDARESRVTVEALSILPAGLQAQTYHDGWSE